MSIRLLWRPGLATWALFLGMMMTVPAMAGPLFDPFLEEFLVGTHLDPDTVPMAGLWPGGLLTPLVVQQAWLDAATELLEQPEAHPEALTHRFLGCLPGGPFGSTEAMADAVRELASSQEAGDLSEIHLPAPGFLRTERWRAAIFAAQDRGLAAAGARLIQEGLASDDIKLTERERFVWELRQRHLEKLSGKQARPLQRPWPADSDLGPYDRNAVWSLWLAHRRVAGLPVLPPDFKDEVEAERLAGLRQPGLTPSDLEKSAFNAELRAGLGAALFEDAELEAHLANYPAAPGNFSVQGWWVKGQRFNRRGNPAHYEELARRNDLHPGWRLDVWRRASELRLLKGQWDQGLQDLDEALAIARQGGGTVSLRRRLRQWVEQAAVLALAQGRQADAWALLDKGDATFSGEAGEVFQQETRHWRQIRQGNIPDSFVMPQDAFDLVAAGLAQDLRPATGQPGTELKTALVTAADRPLWDLWFTWGVALADPAPLSGQVLERALAYREVLDTGLAAGDMRGKEDALLAAVALRFADRPEILQPLVTKLVDRDVGRLSSWATAPRPSPVPGLLPVLRRSQLDMHAALGLALITGDMRGTVGLAYELPGDGLTVAQKRLFLYPLPAEGPIREALLAAESEPALVLAVARNESLFEPAVRSRAGALGWMQIMPFHFPSRGALPGSGNWAVPAVSIRLGDSLLTENRRRFGGDPYLTLAAYNAGPGAAERWRRQLGGTERRDIYLAWIGYPETRNYVEKVLIDREIYDWILTQSGNE